MKCIWQPHNVTILCLVRNNIAFSYSIQYHQKAAGSSHLFGAIGSCNSGWYKTSILGHADVEAIFKR